MSPVKKKAISLLARRAYFSKQLKNKLLEKGYPLGEVEPLMVELTQQGWLNDEEMAKRFIEREKQKGYGAKMIALKLKEKGDFLKVAIEESKEAVRDLVAKRYLKQLPDRRPQVIAALMRRGLPYELILEVLETFSGDWYKES